MVLLQKKERIKIKWYKQEREKFQIKKTGLKGRKNNYKFEINNYTEGWGQNHIGWFVSIEDLKTDKMYNSLWDKIWFEEIDGAKIWCENYAKKNKKNRIVKKIN